jgi:hypothetical protein
MKRLALCLTVATLTASWAVSLSAAYNPEVNQTLVGVVDEEGSYYQRIYAGFTEVLGRVKDYGEGEGKVELLRWDPSLGYTVAQRELRWERLGDSCPTEGPYEIAMLPDGTSWVVFVLDGEGQIYTYSDALKWEAVGEPIPGEPPFRLDVARVPGSVGIFPCALGNDGQIWILAAGTWEPHEAPVPLDEPSDFVVVSSVQDTYFIAVDSSGRLFQNSPEGWTNWTTVQHGSPPYMMDGFAFSYPYQTGTFIEVKLVDGTGQVYFNDEGVMIPKGETYLGTAPWDIAVNRNPQIGEHLILLADSEGALSFLDNEGNWKLLIRSFE